VKGVKDMANGSKIIAGLRDMVAYAHGDEAAARVSTVNVPKEVDVRGIRRRLKMTRRSLLCALVLLSALSEIGSREGDIRVGPTGCSLP